MYTKQTLLYMMIIYFANNVYCKNIYTINTIL